MNKFNEHIKKAAPKQLNPEHIARLFTYVKK